MLAQPGRAYLYQLCVNTGCNLENLPEVMGDRDGWRERELGKFMLSVLLDYDCLMGINHPPPPSPKKKKHEIFEILLVSNMKLKLRSLN